MDVLVTGASGFIARALLPALRSTGHRPIVAVRGRAVPSGVDGVSWDPEAGTIDKGALEGIGGVVHLAGAGIGDARWTDDRKQLIVESRTCGTRLLADTLAGLDAKPSVLVSASAIGYYGDRGDEVLDEESPPGSDFLSDLCVRWERSAVAARSGATKVAVIRTGIVLTPKGGALRKELPLFKVGLGGRFGSGTQWQSWISLDDEVGAITHLLDHPADGAFNLTAPNPVTNAEMTKALGEVLHRPTILPIPSFGPKLLLGGELAEALLFTSQRAVPAALQANGYEFRHPELVGALRAVLSTA